MNSQNIAATPAHERIDAVEVQERLSWPSAPATAYCDTWLMVNAGALNFKASGEHQVSVMANIGHQLLQEIAAYRPAFKWATSPAEIVGALIEETSTNPPAVPPALAMQEKWQHTAVAVKNRFRRRILRLEKHLANQVEQREDKAIAAHMAAVNASLGKSSKRSHSRAESMPYRYRIALALAALGSVLASLAWCYS
ncbi:hypothetical protein BA896_012595 [Janthinobacterium lividum]|uniref:Uncharacterized protein n=1 Tax=Janthinobacterium lividum TaxID=29581 RepID=A0A1E8PTD9_9BURK|nr:hypothetical protein BA896_012595 [Janthinobacterium lividum]